MNGRGDFDILGDEEALISDLYSFSESLPNTVMRQTIEASFSSQEACTAQSDDSEKDPLLFDENAPASTEDSKIEMSVSVSPYFLYSYSKKVSTYVDSYTLAEVPFEHVISSGRHFFDENGRQLITVKNLFDRNYWFWDDFNPVPQYKIAFISYKNEYLRIDERPVVSSSHLIYRSGEKAGEIAPNLPTKIGYDKKKYLDGQEVCAFYAYKRNASPSFSLKNVSQSQASPLLFKRKNSEKPKSESKRIKREVTNTTDISDRHSLGK